MFKKFYQKISKLAYHFLSLIQCEKKGKFNPKFTFKSAQGKYWALQLFHMNQLRKIEVQILTNVNTVRKPYQSIIHLCFLIIS